MYKKFLFGLLLGTSIISQAAQPQKEGEPINAPGDIPLGGFPGCSVQPPKDGCDARISCHGVGTLFGNTGMDLQAATDEAVMEAKNELAKFYSNKQKAQQSLSKVREDTAKSTSDGGKAISSSMTRMMASVSSSSAESVLSGVQVLGRVVDTNQQSVTVKIGVSCKSQAAAAKSQAASARSANPTAATPQSKDKQASKPAKTEAESFKVGPGNLKNMNQEINNADDF
jgi:hypothetical protein